MAARRTGRSKRWAAAAVTALSALFLPSAAWAQSGPNLTAALTNDDIQGFDFAANATVMVQVYSGFGGTLLWSGTVPTFEGGSFFVSRGDHGQDLVPGLFVQATDGAVAKVMTLAPLSIGAVDRAADTVSGTAAPGVSVTVGAFDPGVGSAVLAVEADGSTGAWLASFSGVYDITATTSVWASVADADGDRTQAGRWPPVIQGNLAFDSMNGQGFAPNSAVSLAIGGWTGSAPTDGNGSFFIDRSVHGQDLVPGMTVGASDGTEAKSLTLAALAISAIDPATDTVTGTAPPLAFVNVNAFTPPSGGGGFVPGVQADGSGNWTANFSPGFDITPMTHVSASTTDGDGDSTQYDKDLARIQGNIDSDQVSGMGFDRDAEVAVLFGGFSGTAPTDSWGNFFLDRNVHNVDLTAGMTITVSDTQGSKSLTLDAALAIGSVDALNDVVSGAAQPGAAVSVNVNNPFAGTGSSLSTVADGGGAWSVDFHGMFDVTGGTYVSASVADADGDATAIDRPAATFNADTDFDGVDGNGFAHSGTVTVTIYDAPEGTVLATRTAPTDPDGNFGLDGMEHGVDLQPGIYITVSDGTVAKDLILVGVTVDLLDASADTVTGTAPPGTTVSVGVGDSTGGEMQQVTADGNGDWTASFTDVLPTYGANAWVYDDDGDATSASRNPAEIEGSITDDYVAGNGFARDGEVDISIDGTPAGTAPTDGWGGFWADNLGVDLVPGTAITVTDGSTTKDLTLVALAVGAVDPSADTVEGTAPVGALVGVNVSSGMSEGGWLETTATDGTWSVDFTGVYDIGGTWLANAEVRDADGDRTTAGRQTPVLDVNLTWANISGEGFASNGSVALALYDSLDALIWSGTTGADGGGRFQVEQNEFQSDLLPGMRVTADDGQTAKELVLANLGITEVDRLADVVTGGAPAGADVEVNAWDLFSSATLQVTASGAGGWTADFTGVYDIGGGTDIGVSVYDADGDRSSANREPPTIDANITYDTISGSGFEAGSTVAVTIEAAGGGQVFSESVLAENGEFWLDVSSASLAPGVHVVANDGTTAKDLTLVDMSVTAVDPATDTVSGAAPPDARVWVEVWDRNADAWMEVSAGGDGLWTADFSGQLDLTAMAHANAQVQDDDRDRTSWDRSATSLLGNLTFDSVHGEGFAADGSVAIAIDGVPWPEPVPTRTDGSFDFEPGVDLVAGMELHVSSPGHDRVLTLAPVTVDSLDTAADTVNGTAAPGAQVLVGAGDWSQGAELFVTADGGGAWVADFTGVFDVDAATSASAQVFDDDGDRTMAERRPPACVRDGTTLLIAANQEATVRRAGTSIQVLIDGVVDAGCAGATVSNVDTVVRHADGPVPFTIDLSGGAFAPGATSEGKSSEIEFQVDGAVVVNGTAAADVITIGTNGINLNNDGDVDVTGNWSQVTVNGGGGNDVISAAGGGAAGGVFAGAVVLNGGAGNDTLTGGSGPDTLSGDGGKDVLSGREGVNTLDGGVDIDRAVYSWWSGGVSVDLGTGVATGGVVDDTLTAIEDLVGSSGPDTLVGSLAANVIEAGAGNDWIDLRDGISGNDSANGGAGTDTCLADPRDRRKSCEA